jgi:hypothetical protein
MMKIIENNWLPASAAYFTVVVLVVDVADRLWVHRVHGPTGTGFDAATRSVSRNTVPDTATMTCSD